MDKLNNTIEEQNQITENSETEIGNKNEPIDVEHTQVNQQPLILKSEEESPRQELDEDFDDEDDTPTLYSENLIYTFSVLFSVLAGGILLSRNLKEVGRKDGIPHVIAFSLIYTMLSSYLLNVSKFGLVGTVLLAIIGSMVLNSYFWNAYIGKGVVYYRKSYRKALIITLLILIPLMLFVVWSGAISGGETPVDGMRIN